MGKVQIMTLHKSKGDEFDYVFLPEMLEKSLPLEIENVTLKKNARFMEDVRELNPNYKQKTDDEMKEFLLAENLRLMYVAITRAKRKLFITANRTTRTSVVPLPSAIFKYVKGGTNESNN
jgi:superfamily I DNA/RNA helicase